MGNGQFVWTNERVAHLRKMLDEKRTYVHIAAVLGCGVSTVYHKANSATVRKKGDSKRTWEPLPAGHPATWGAISSGRWPGKNPGL